MPEPQNRPLRVFLCHSSDDKPTVRELYQKLNSEGWIDVWLDEEKLLPGQDWDYEIEKALDNSDAVIATLSTGSVSKEGYVQKELRFVLDIALEKPEGTIYILPVRLDDCERPRRLRSIQGVDYFPPERREWAYARLRQSLELRAKALGIAIEKNEPTTSLSKPVTTEKKAQSNVSPKPAKAKSIAEPAKSVPKKKEPEPKLNSPRVQIMVNPSNLQLVSQPTLTLDGKTISLKKNLPHYLGREITIFNKVVGVGEHEIFFESSGLQGFETSKKFSVAAGQIATVTLLLTGTMVNKYNPRHWEISVKLEP